MEVTMSHNVLITGAAGRIGGAFTKAVLDNGGSVTACDIDCSRLREKFASSSRIHYIEGDITVRENIAAAVAEAADIMQSIDAVVHSAYPVSQGWGVRFEDIEPEHLYEDITNQLGGAILLSQQVMKFFMKQGCGHLIHVSSIQGVTAPKFHHYDGTDMVSPIEYSAIKAGIINVTKYLAKYYRGNNIRVNCISPGGVLAGQPDSFQRAYAADCNSKGMLEAEDLVAALLYLLSDGCRTVTGQNLIVDDGWSL